MILSRISPIAKATIDRNLFTDPLLTKAAVLKQFVSNTFDVTTNRNVVVYNDIPLTVVEMKHTEESKKASSAKVEVGQTLFLIRFDDLASPPTLKDTIQITAESKVYTVSGIDTMFNILYSVSVTNK